MKILVRLARGNAELRESMVDFARGVRLCGDVADEDLWDPRRPALSPADLEPYKLVVVWNRFRMRKMLDAVRGAGVDVMVMERGYIGDREQWFSCGFNDINGCAEWEIGRGLRWRKLWNPDELLKPWSMDYDHALIIGQVPRDGNLIHCRDIWRWYQRVADAMRRQGLEVRFRRHPDDRRSPAGYCPCGAVPDGDRGLEEAMRRAVVVTYSSNVGSLAVLAGRPVIAADSMSMVHGRASGSLDLRKLRAFYRVRWLRRMAWCQWHRSELADGTAWRRLRKRFIK